MTKQQLLGQLRRAITDYDMIKDGDKIAVGVSGGKDSLTLLTLLHAYQKFCPQKFQLMGITIDLGFGKDAYAPIAKYCSDLDIPYEINVTQIADVIFNIRKEKNPCSLCSKMRRGALNTTLLEKGFNKLALGHHSDDIVETFLLSLCYEGRLNSFAPMSLMDRTNVTLIRPMVYMEEKNINAFAKDLPVVHNPCPANHHTQREYMKNLLKTIQKDIPFAKDRMISAIMSPERYNLWPEKSKQNPEND